jgi:hypothetical protein
MAAASGYTALVASGNIYIETPLAPGEVVDRIRSLAIGEPWTTESPDGRAVHHLSLAALTVDAYEYRAPPFDRDAKPLGIAATVVLHLELFGSAPAQAIVDAIACATAVVALHPPAVGATLSDADVFVGDRHGWRVSPDHAAWRAVHPDAPWQPL